MVGKTLGHYEILELLGAGGMGEVYRARDTTLKREVAIKVLPEQLSADPDRLARLEREAHLLAALSHANIATIHALEEDQGARFLVLELVKGESLEQRLSKGPLPVETALDLCKQIAEALEAAHGEGIIHRDLKPANVLITPEGKAKVLDFGLAKTVEAAPSEADMSRSPTLTVAGTQTGVILGTAPYMSPEQVRGQPLDKRADIWAFGCVLYKALVGRRAFNRETVADTLAAIIEAEPDWGALPTTTPALVVALLRRCLRKNPDRRLHDIADARIEIEEALGEGTDAISPMLAAPVAVEMTRGIPWKPAAPMAVAGLVVGSVVTGALVWTLVRPAPPPPVPVVRSLLTPSATGPVEVRQDVNVALTPDGTWLVYVGAPDGNRSLYVRSLSGIEATQLTTTGLVPRNPFISPDGNWVGFWSAPPPTLHRVSIHGGPHAAIVEVPQDSMRGAS